MSTDANNLRKKNVETEMSTKKTFLYISMIFIVIAAVILQLLLIKDNGHCKSDISQPMPPVKVKNVVKHDIPFPHLSSTVKPQSLSPHPKPSDVNSVVQFLSQLNSLSVDDFVTINDGRGNDKLTLSVVSNFNNIHISPRMRSIVEMDYFRFVKLNLQRLCSLWNDYSKCSLRDCSVQLCDESQLPQSIVLDDDSNLGSSIAVTLKSLKTDINEDDDCPNDSPKKLSAINSTISLDQIETMNTLFECSEDDDQSSQYIDLLLNPERFTGYDGESAHRIWRSIYEENCFLKYRKSPFSLDSLCFEERIFYRVISGLHTSINIHLCSSYLMMDGNFAPNLNEFIKRFHGKSEHIKNLYFIYLLELRALHKAEPYLLNRVNWQSSGVPSLTKEAIKDLLRIVKTFKWSFDETVLFKNQPPTVAHEFAQHFTNITTNIMDCVACDKCKLWGKVQTHGLGTAFKILLTNNMDKLTLNRHEITCLINSLAKLSHSIAQIEHFTKMITGK